MDLRIVRLPAKGQLLINPHDSNVCAVDFLGPSPTFDDSVDRVFQHSGFDLEGRHVTFVKRLYLVIFAHNSPFLSARYC